MPKYRIIFSDFNLSRSRASFLSIFSGKDEYIGWNRFSYTGVSTIFLSQIIADIIESHPNLSGLKQLSIEKPISKYELLCLAREAFKCNIEIIPDESFELKPTLNGENLKDELDYVVPTWERMMNDLANDPFKY